MSTPLAVQALRKQLFDSGFPFVPVTTGSKKPIGGEWPARARALTAESASAYPDGNALNTGILADVLVPVDIDTDDPTLAHWIVELAKTTLGTAPLRYRTNSSKCLLLYRSTEDKVNSANVADAAGKKILEVLGQGRQFVAYGMHPSDIAYCWTTELRTIHRNSLTAVSPQQVSEFLTTVADRIGGNASRSRLQSGEPVATGPATAEPIPTEDETRTAQMILDKLCGELRAMREGEGRNGALNIAAVQMGELSAGWGIPRQPIADALLLAMQENGYVAKDGLHETKETLASGFRKGLSNPRPRLPDIDISRFLKRYDPTKNAPMVAKPNVPRAVVLTSLASVQEVPIDWHWNQWLPRGMLTLLSGDGGTGKSTLAFSLAATITTGGVWPDGQRCTGKSNVLIWSGEDSLIHTIKPRLMAAKADINRVAAIESTTDESGVRQPFDPASDMDNLRTEVRRIGGISLLIIDPIVSAVVGDINKANDVRRSLQPIVDFATEFDCAVLGITHFGKATAGRKSAERVIGSQAFAALARMVWATAKEEESDMRVLTRSKSNISADEGGVIYTIEPIDVKAGNGATIQTTRVVWGSSIQGTSRSILSSVESEDTERYGKKMDEAKNFLYNTLANGPIPVKQVQQLARNAHIAHVTLQRAKDAMNIQSAKRKGEFVDGWEWSLPAQMIPPPENLLRG